MDENKTAALLTPDTAQALNFLAKWKKNGPWMLGAIHPETGRISGTYFTSLVDAAPWIDERQGKENLYFMVNPAKHEIKGVKASKKDIASLDWLHVDCDPRVAEDFEKERVRILRTLKATTPAPTIIIDSGGGYQAFWRLGEPITIKDEEHAKELERYNKQLEIQYGGDNCHNVDRIMRLVGTINLPNEKKRKKGREPAATGLITENWNTEYALDTFTPAHAAPTPSSGDKPKINLGTLPAINSEDDLPDNLSQRTRNIILTGAREGTNEQSRSEPQFAAVCDMVRQGVEDEVIAAILTSPHLAISASTLDKKNPMKYALRQISRAHDMVTHPQLLEMNEKYAVISDDGGKVVVVSEASDPLFDDRTRVSRQTFESFKKRFNNIPVMVEDKKLPMGSWWLGQQRRRQYDTIGFLPNIDNPLVYNLWRGFDVEATTGSGHISFLEHIRDNVCGKNEANYIYLINWMARAIQQPQYPGEVAVVLTGKKGTGKSAFGTHFGKLFGRHFLHLTQGEHLTGKFNAHLEDCLLALADEAIHQGDKQQEATLKTLITERSFFMERKGIDSMQVPNRVHLIIASNNAKVVPYSMDERRFFVLEIGEDKRLDTSYFAQISDDLTAGGYGDLLGFLQRTDLKNWNHRDVPFTEAAQAQLVESMDKFTETLVDSLIDGQTIGMEIQKKKNPELMCLNAFAKRAKIHPLTALRRLQKEEVLQDTPFVQHKIFKNPDGSISTYKGKMEGAIEMEGSRMYFMKSLKVLREKFGKYVHDEWPEDGNEWRMNAETDDEAPF